VNWQAEATQSTKRNLRLNAQIPKQRIGLGLSCMLHICYACCRPLIDHRTQKDQTSWKALDLQTALQHTRRSTLGILVVLMASSDLGQTC